MATEDREAAGFIILIPQPCYLLLENVAVLPACPRYGSITNEAMTENLAHYPRHGYTGTHRAQQDGFRRVFFRKCLDT